MPRSRARAAKIHLLVVGEKEAEAERSMCVSVARQQPEAGAASNNSWRDATQKLIVEKSAGLTKINH